MQHGQPLHVVVSLGRLKPAAELRHAQVTIDDSAELRPEMLHATHRATHHTPLFVSDPAAGHPSMLTATTMLKADAGDGVRLFVTVTRDMFSGLGRAGIRTGDVSENRTFIVPYILPYVYIGELL